MWFAIFLIFTVFGSSSFATSYPKDTCGLRPLVNVRSEPERIVGGQVAKVGDWPWQISMLLNGRHICGGSLIADEWIITAAHCVVGNTNVGSYRILLGVHDRDYPESWVISKNIKRIIVHPKYDSKLIRDDIALMQLSTPIDTYTNTCLPVCLPVEKQSVENAIGTTTGWGAQAYGGSVTRYLLQVSSRIYTDVECEKIFNLDMTDRNVQICSGGNSTGACQGDSGGPIVIREEKGQDVTFTLVGLTSWGVNCGRGGVYTRVSAYLDWIASYVNPQ